MRLSTSVLVVVSVAVGCRSAEQPTTAGSGQVFDGGMDGGPPLVIVQNQTPLPGCIVPLRSSSRATSGVYDVALDRAYPYLLFPLLRDTRAGDGEDTPLALDSFRVSVRGPVGLTLDWPANCPGEFRYPTRVTLFRGGVANIDVGALRECHGDHLRRLFVDGRLPASLSDEVILRVVVTAEGRVGGSSVSSPPFEFPVRVCSGCLQTGFTDPAYASFAFPNVPLCSALAANPYRGNPCNPAQDLGPILCCVLDRAADSRQCPALGR